MAKKGFGVLCLGRLAEIMTKWRDLFGVSSSCMSETYLQWCRMEINVYIFIHEKHELGSTITNSMVSVVLPWKD